MTRLIIACVSRVFASLRIKLFTVRQKQTNERTNILTPLHNINRQNVKANKLGENQTY